MGWSRPSTIRGTTLAGFRECPAQSLFSGRARRGPVSRTLRLAVSLHYLKAPKHWCQEGQRKRLVRACAISALLDEFNTVVRTH